MKLVLEPDCSGTTESLRKSSPYNAMLATKQPVNMRPAKPMIIGYHPGHNYRTTMTETPRRTSKSQ